jgi:hypothetical protein
MRTDTDDEVYRVNAIWLGPPELTFPWRARYVAYALFMLAAMVLFALFKAWWGVGVFSVGWAILIALWLTRRLTRKIDPERPLTTVIQMAGRELVAPRQQTQTTGGATAANLVRIRSELPYRPFPHPSAPATTPRASSATEVPGA